MFARTLNKTLIAAAFGSLAACMSAAPAGSGGQAPEPVPARWKSPSMACLSEAQAFAAQVTGRRVSFGEPAFERGAELVLDSINPLDAQGRPLDGRRRSVPGEVFRLELLGPACQMTHAASARSAALPACRCTPL